MKFLLYQKKALKDHDSELFILISGNLKQGSRKIWMHTVPLTYSHAGVA